MDLIKRDLKIDERIYSVRGRQVMIDRDLAELYGVETKALNQAVKRNIESFLHPSCFDSNRKSLWNWSQFVTGLKN